MLHKNSAWQALIMHLLSIALVSCYHPPYNNFKPYHREIRPAIEGAAIGAAATYVAGGSIIGGASGVGMLGLAAGFYKESKSALIKELQRQQILYNEYGDTVTLIVPTDRYFVLNSAHFNETCATGLMNIVKFVQLYSPCPVYIAAFTDNVGSRDHKRMLSQAQAETMATYLWANDIPSERLYAEGYGDKNTVSDNQLIHGSAQNRRLEIQWHTAALCPHPATG